MMETTHTNVKTQNENPKSTGTAVRVLKIIVLSLLALAELLLLAGFILESIWSGWDTFAPDDQSVRICLFCLLGGWLAVSIAEIVRAAGKKKWVLLPMLGMKVTIAVASMGISMIYEYILLPDTDSLGAGIMLVICALVFVGAGCAIRYRSRTRQAVFSLCSWYKEPKTQDAHRPYAVLLHAAWYQEAALSEYCRLHGLDLEKTLEELELRVAVDDRGRRGLVGTGAIRSPEADALAGQMYLYACNYVGYLTAWLIRRNGLRNDLEAALLQERLLQEKSSSGQEQIQVTFTGFAEHLARIRQGQGDPARFVYDYMQGRFRESYFGPADIQTFICLYCNENRDPKSGYWISKYQRDYGELILQTAHWCRDFSWERYLQLEAVLDKRYEIYRRNTARSDRQMYLEEYPYSHTLKQVLAVETECVEDQEWDAFNAYIHKCLEQVDRMPEHLLPEICAAFVECWGEDWVGQLTPETFCKAVYDGAVEIQKPYGEELAYILSFEAAFEEEHGIAIAIKDGHVLDVGYRMDVASPWALPENRSAEELLANDL